MKRKYEVRPGQKWLDTDPRMRGRYVIVIKINGDKVICMRSNLARMTKLGLTRMEAGKGWRPENPVQAAVR